MKLTKAKLQQLIKEALEDSGIEAEIDAERAAEGLPPYEEDVEQQDMERRADQFVDRVHDKIEQIIKDWSWQRDSLVPESQLKTLVQDIKLATEEDLLDMALAFSKAGGELDEGKSDPTLKEI